MIDPNDFEEAEPGFGCALCPVTRRTRRALAAHVREMHVTALEPLAHPGAARFTATDDRLEAARLEIAALKAAADDVAARMAKLDADAAERNRVRLETLREASQMLYAVGELAASKLVMDVIRKEV